MFIIKCSNKNQPNWSGKEFSKDACKIYSSFSDACDALGSYWYGGYNTTGYDHRGITITPLTEKKMVLLVGQKKIRW